jgi:hypothetical protein
MGRLMGGVIGGFAAACVALSAAGQPFVFGYPQQLANARGGVAALAEQAAAYAPYLTTDSGRALAAGIADLPPRLRRWVWTTPAFDETLFYNEQTVRGVTIRRNDAVQFFSVGEYVYYAGRQFDTPLIDLRSLDLALSGTALAEPAGLAGARILLVDPRLITHAWLLAQRGAHVTVVSRSVRFHALYDAPSDRGPVRGVGDAPDGSVTIVEGNWPGEAAAVEAAGGEFDLIFALNALNMGRVDPSAPHSRWANVVRPPKSLGMTEAEAAAMIAGRLAPGGRLVINSWGRPAAAFGGAYSVDGDVRPGIGTDAASAAGLNVVAYASDTAAMARLMGIREQSDIVRSPIGENLELPQLTSAYAIYQKPLERG